FSNQPSIIFETYKARAFFSYIVRNENFRSKTAAYFEASGCSSPIEYLNKVLAFVTPTLQHLNSDNPGDYFILVKADYTELVLEGLTIDPDEIKNDVTKQFDYRGLKEKPLFNFGDNEYIVPNWHFLYSALFNG